MAMGIAPPVVVVGIATWYDCMLTIATPSTTAAGDKYTNDDDDTTFYIPQFISRSDCGGDWLPTIRPADQIRMLIRPHRANRASIPVYQTRIKSGKVYFRPMKRVGPYKEPMELQLPPHKAIRKAKLVYVNFIVLDFD